jgi:glucose/arabinose dehydrogenase
VRSIRVRAFGITIIGVLVWAAAAAGAGGSVGVIRPRSETLPGGFTDTLVGSVEDAIALAPTPDGRMLVADQLGRLRVIKNGVVLATPALDISAKVCALNSERGLLGVAVDPNFASNGFVYVYYTFRNNTNCGTLSTKVPVNRVARFTMTGDTINPSTEKILIDGIVSYHANHEGGDLGFGKDGMLYASIGDGDCDYTKVSGCDPNNTIAHLGNTLRGKVIRITSTGGIPSTNPYLGSGTARCNHGGIAAGLTCQEIYMRGFRNPFRFAFDPNSSRTRLFVNDVGQDTWEEIDKAVKGADYGWNTREGPCAEGSLTDCGTPPAGLTNPIFAYSHVSTGCDATITGGAFVPNGLWGTNYDSGYLYADYLCNEIFLIVPNGTGGWTSSPFASGLGVAGPIALRFAPHGTKTALYYTTYANGGEVHVIEQP